MNPTTTPETLTTAELARYLGQQCKHERRNWIDPKTAIWEEWQAPLDVELLSQKSDDVRNIRPVLKRLANITQEDAKAVLGIAGLNPGDYGVDLTTSDAGFSVTSDKRSLIVMRNGQMFAATSFTGSGLTFNAVAVINYLREKGYDLENWIQSGKAIEAQP